MYISMKYYCIVLLFSKTTHAFIADMRFLLLALLLLSFLSTSWISLLLCAFLAPSGSFGCARFVRGAGPSGDIYIYDGFIWQWAGPSQFWSTCWSGENQSSVSRPPQRLAACPLVHAKPEQEPALHPHGAHTGARSMASPELGETLPPLGSPSATSARLAGRLTLANVVGCASFRRAATSSFSDRRRKRAWRVLLCLNLLICPRSAFERIGQNGTGGLRQEAGGCRPVAGRLGRHSQSPAGCWAGCQVSAEHPLPPNLPQRPIRGASDLSVPCVSAGTCRIWLDTQRCWGAEWRPCTPPCMEASWPGKAPPTPPTWRSWATASSGGGTHFVKRSPPCDDMVGIDSQTRGPR